MDRGEFRGRIRVAACLLPTLAIGCSFVFTEGPEPPLRHRPPQPPDCSTSRAPPIVDTILAGSQLLRAGAAVDASDADYQGESISRREDVALGVGLTALFGLSAIYGFHTTSECDDTKDAWQREHVRPVYAPPPYSYPYPLQPYPPRPYAPPPVR